MSSKVCSSTVSVALLAAMGAVSAAAQVSTFTSFPPLGQEALVWDGPATAQMVMAGYPTPPGPCSQSQDDIAAAILAGKVEPSWESDPAGMKAALTGLCPPSGSWSIFQNTDPQALMHSVARWMKLRHYPVALVFDTEPSPLFPAHQEHWVAIEGIVTDLDPTTAAAVTLQWIFFVDPRVPVGDTPVPRFISGTTWYSEFKPVTKAGSSFVTKHVAIIEPPTSPGRAVAGTRVLTGRVLTLAVALRRATQTLRSLSASVLPLHLRELAQLRPGPPILVNPRKGGYFLIPLAPAGGRPKLAVLLNAYTGELEEIGPFSRRPILSRDQALARGRALLGNVAGLDAVLEAPVTGLARFQPVWRVEAAGKAVTIDSDEQ